MAERDPEIRLGDHTDRAEALVASGHFESIDQVVGAALDALGREQQTFNAVVRAKVAEAMTDPRPPIPLDEAFRRLDDAKARRRGE